MIALFAALLVQAAPVEDTRPVVWDCIRVGMTEREAEASCGKKHYSDALYHYTASFKYENKGKTVSSLTLRSFFTTGATMMAGLEAKYGQPTSNQQVERDMLEAQGSGYRPGSTSTLYVWKLPHMTVEYLQPYTGQSGQVRYTVVDQGRNDLTF